jgi:hypothetical protein
VSDLINTRVNGLVSVADLNEEGYFTQLDLKEAHIEDLRTLGSLKLAGARRLIEWAIKNSNEGGAEEEEEEEVDKLPRAKIHNKKSAPFRAPSWS